MKKILVIIALIIAAALVLGVLKDQIIKTVVTVSATRVTGAPVSIGGFSLGIINHSVRISGFKMYNPKGFSKSILVDLPKINVKLDVAALFKGRLHLPSTEIELKEMGLEKNKDGQMNVDSLKVVEEGKKEKAKGEAKPAKQIPMQIDTLKLKIGKIVSRDYSAGQEPSIKVYDVNIDKTFNNITSSQQLVALIIAEPMKAAGIQAAKIYGVAAVAGVAVLPVAVAAQFAGKDFAQQDFNAPSGKAFDAGIQALKEMGKVIREDKAGGIIEAEVNSAKVVFKLKSLPDKKTQVTISARRYLLPRPEIAAGVLYQVSEKLK